MNEKKFLCRMWGEDNLSQSEMDFYEYVWNTYCFYYASKTNDGRIFFYRVKSEKNEPLPDLVLKKNEYYIVDEKQKKEYKLIYSYDDFINSHDRNIQENEVTKKLKLTLGIIQDKFYEEKEKCRETNKKEFKPDINRQTVILTNEGTGKSKIVLDQIKNGEIYTAPDREILTEKEKYLTSIGKKFKRFYSNGDIIYSVVKQNRHNHDIASEISTLYLEECKHLDRDIDKDKLSEDLKKLNDRNTGYILKELNKLSKDSKIEYEEENSSVSLISFLKENEDLTNQEKREIITYYNYLLHMLVEGKTIITCTTHKMKILLQKMTHERPILIYCDEIVDDIHGNAMVLNKNVINESTFKFITHNTTLRERGMELREKVKSKFETLRDRRDVKDWYKISSYHTYNSLVEIKNNSWIEMNDTFFIILTTEEKSKIIFPEAGFYDFRHMIYEDNINIICIDNFNSSKNTEKFFTGNERNLIVKACAETIFNIKSKYYIGNGIGHSLENNLPNIYNVRGTNNMFTSLKEEKGEKSLGIAIKPPHPESINLHKALYYATMENIDFKEVLTESENIEPDMSAIITNDQFHQCVGRANGYRKIEGVKTYIFLTAKLLNQLKPYYVTKNVFKLTNFLNQKSLREEHPDISKFLITSNLLLNLKRIKSTRVEKDKNFSRYIEKLVEDINLKKYIDISKEFINSIILEFVSLYKFYLYRLRECLNRIKFKFSFIKFIKASQMDKIDNSVFSKLNETLYNIISKSKIQNSKRINHRSDSEDDFSSRVLPRSGRPKSIKLLNPEILIS